MDIFREAAGSVDRRGFFNIAPGLTKHEGVMAQHVRLVEEVGELSRALRKDDGSDEAYRARCEELADVVIVCASMAHVLGIDLWAEIQRKLKADELRGLLHGEG
jgi:hypothetical protein